MKTISLAFFTSLIPFIAVWFAILNPFLKSNTSMNATIQAIAAGFITGSILVDMAPRLLGSGLKLSYIIAFITGFVTMIIIQGGESGCCSGDTKARTLIKFLIPFAVEFIITAVLIGIAAVANSSLLYVITISFGLCNFVCGTSISSRFAMLELSPSSRVKYTIMLTIVFPIIATLTVLLASYVTATLMNELIAFALALLLYLAVMELLPEVLLTYKKRASILFFCSIAFVFALTYFLM